MTGARILVLAAHGVRRPLDGVSRPLFELCNGLTRTADVALLTATPSTEELDCRVIESPRRRRVPVVHPGAHLSTRHSFGRYRRRDLDAAISAEDPDVVVSYLVHPMYLALASGRPTVFVAQDVLAELIGAQREVSTSRLRRAALALSRRQILRVERRAFRAATASTVVSEAEAVQAEALYGVRPTVVANGVTSVARPAEPLAPAAPSPDQVVLFVGNLGAPKNAAAAVRLVERILPQLDGVRAIIAGAAPTPELRRTLAASGTETHFDVDDLTPLYRRARVAVAPHESGTGIKNSVLEALAHRVAVVASPAAVIGLAGEGRACIEVAADDAGFIAGVRRLIDDGDERDARAEAGLAYVRRNHSWSGYVDAIAERCLAAAQGKRVR